MPNTSKLLLNEDPLIVLPTLAVKIGLNDAIMLQQIHYWLKQYEKAKDQSHFYDGRYWVYNSYGEWKDGNFPFWSEGTIKRIALKLELKGLVITRQDSGGKKWYTIDYNALEKATTPDQVDLGGSDQIAPGVGSTCAGGSDQLAPGVGSS